jgi:tetratricopeptide (TPR) repeat protein
MAAPRRRFYHRRVAEALAHLAPDEPGALAHHWTLAEVWDKATYYHQQAGNQARAVYGNSEASTHYTQALDALARQSGSVDPLRAFELYLAREEVYALRGDRAAQAEDLASLESLSEDLDDGEYGGLERRAAVALRRARYAEVTSDYPAASAAGQHAVTLAQSAHQLASDLSDSELAQVQAARLESAGYLIWGAALWRQGDNPTARERLEQALALAQIWDLRDLEADSLRNLGLVCLNGGDYADAESYFEQTLELTCRHGDRQCEAVALNSLGIASSSQGHYARARDFYERSLHIAREIGDRRSESVALNNLGTVLQYQGDYEGARSYFEQVLRLFREVGDRQSEGLALANLGDVADYKGDYKTARDYYAQSLRVFREVGDRQTEGWILGNLGNACDSLADYAAASSFHEQALQALRQVGDRRGEGFVVTNQSLLDHHMGDDRAALERSQEALRSTKALGDRLNQGYAWTNQGHALVGLHRLDEAVDAYRQALHLRRELRQDNLAVEPLAGLARISLARGDQVQAMVCIEEILEHLETNPGLDGTDEPLRVYLTCFQTLHTQADPRGPEILRAAHQLLQEQASRIGDKVVRQTFLQNTAAHREILAAYRGLEARPSHTPISVRLARAGAPTGRPLRQDEYVTVTWTVDTPEDRAIPGKADRRRHRLLRLLRETQEQDATPTVGDLADALEVSPGTVKRDLSALRKAGHNPHTRGSRTG